MKCKKIQEFIITDYIDAQMGDKQRGLIDQHLEHCHACANFLTSVKREAVNPFINISQDVPDQILWIRIKQAIDLEQELQVKTSLAPDFWERLRSVVYIPRPILALATVVMMIFMVGLPGQLAMNTQMVKINGQEQMQYLSSLVDESTDLALNNGNDSQTPIEKYFL